MSKGSRQRPGTGYQSNFDRIFNKDIVCEPEYEVLAEKITAPDPRRDATSRLQLELARRAMTIADTSNMTRFDSSMTREQIAERFGQNVTVTMICNTCGVNRFKLPCPSREICPMKATTGGQS